MNWNLILIVLITGIFLYFIVWKHLKEVRDVEGKMAEERKSFDRSIAIIDRNNSRLQALETYFQVAKVVSFSNIERPNIFGALKCSECEKEYSIDLVEIPKTYVCPHCFAVDSGFVWPKDD